MFNILCDFFFDDVTKPKLNLKLVKKVPPQPACRHRYVFFIFQTKNKIDILNKILNPNFC